MTEAINWAILVVAGASLIFAVLAYRSVMRTTGRIDGWLSRAPSDFSHILSPTYLGDAIHHALMRDDGAVMQELGEHANGIVAEQMPLAARLLAQEAIAAVSVMTTPGQAKALKDKSGAARGYLQLGGSIQRQAVKTGVESMAGGAFGEAMAHPVYGPILQQVITGIVAKQMGGGNGQQQQPQQQGQLPALGGSPV